MHLSNDGLIASSFSTLRSAKSCMLFFPLLAGARSVPATFVAGAIVQMPFSEWVTRYVLSLQFLSMLAYQPGSTRLHPTYQLLEYRLKKNHLSTGREC